MKTARAPNSPIVVRPLALANPVFTTGAEVTRPSTRIICPYLYPCLIPVPLPLNLPVPPPPPVPGPDPYLPTLGTRSLAHSREGDGPDLPHAVGDGALRRKSERTAGRKACERRWGPRLRALG